MAIAKLYTKMQAELWNAFKMELLCYDKIYVFI